MSRHGPDCYACTDPAGAAEQIAEQRAEIKELRVRARQHREWAEWINGRFYRFAAAGSNAEFKLIQDLMEHHFGTANALAGGANFDSARLDRAIAAHPALDTPTPTEGETP